MRPERLALAFLVALAGACWPATPAVAQIRVERSVTAGAPMGGGGGASISSKSVDRYGKLLGLSEDQAAAVKELHEGYLAESKRLGEEMQQSMTELRKKAEGDGFRVFSEEMPKVMRANAEKRRKLEQEFFAEMKLLLDGSQQSRWPAVERMRRRETGLRSGFVSGEGIDLVDVVDGLKLEASAVASLAETMEQYAMDMDRAIVDREKAEEERNAGAADGVAMFSPESMDEHMKAMREAGGRIRDINKRYARLIEGGLPDDVRPAFAAKIERLSFPQVYRTSHASKQIGAATKFHDLSAEQKRAVDEIRSSYEREASDLNRRWASAIAKAEAEGGSGGAMFTTGGGDMIAIAGLGGEAEDVSAARKARKDLDDRMSKRLASILNEDQNARLPKEEQRGSVQTLTHGDGAFEANIVVIESDEGLDEVEAEDPDGPPDR